MIQFTEAFPDIENVVTLSRHLSWSHFLVLIPIKNPEARNYYSKLTFEGLFGVRELRKQIEKKSFERTENANIQLHENTEIEKGIFKDPYLLDFLELKDGYLENELESAILKEFVITSYSIHYTKLYEEKIKTTAPAQCLFQACTAA